MQSLSNDFNDHNNSEDGVKSVTYRESMRQVSHFIMPGLAKCKLNMGFRFHVYVRHKLNGGNNSSCVVR